MVDGDGVIELPNDEAHHLRDVLRLGSGAEVQVFDGRGHEWAGLVEVVSRAGARVRLGQALTPVPEC
jgi:16S rRNA (uracil1498-N3)-methyltransferase